MALIISETAVRDYLELNTPGSSSKYSDATIGSNIRAATSNLEHICGRFFQQRDGVTWATTSQNRTLIPIPGFRSFTSVTLAGTALTVGLPGGGGSPTVWALPETNPGVPTPLYTALQFRAFLVRADGPWYWHDPLWWDRNLDNMYYWTNSATSMPNDLVVVGNGGYVVGTEPEGVLHAIKVLSAFYTVRPASILADVAITPAGGVLNYSQMPAEVRDFIADYKGQTPQMVSV